MDGWIDGWMDGGLFTGLDKTGASTQVLGKGITTHPSPLSGTPPDTPPLAPTYRPGTSALGARCHAADKTLSWPPAARKGSCEHKGMAKATR